jgi:hypothetical protein
MPQKFLRILKLIKDKMKTKILSILVITFALLVIASGFISALAINSVTMNPTSISPGDSSTVVISLKNNGDNDLTDVSVSLDFTNLPLAPYNSGSQDNFDTIESGKIKDATFNIIATNSAQPGIYKIPVLISYNENDVIKTQQSVISMTVESEPIIDVISQEGLLLKGQNNKITLQVINKGLANVKFLDINIGTSTYYSITSQSDVYIGDVDANDFQTADFNMFFNNNAPRNINLPVTIIYKDITNKQYTQSFDIPIKTYTTSEAQSLGLVPVSSIGYIILIIIILIVIFVIYRIFRARRKRKQNL